MHAFSRFGRSLNALCYLVFGKYLRIIIIAFICSPPALPGGGVGGIAHLRRAPRDAGVLRAALHALRRLLRNRHRTTKYIPAAYVAT